MLLSKSSGGARNPSKLALAHHHEPGQGAALAPRHRAPRLQSLLSCRALAPAISSAGYASCKRALACRWRHASLTRLAIACEREREACMGAPGIIGPLRRLPPLCRQNMKRCWAPWRKLINAWPPPARDCRSLG